MLFPHCLNVACLQGGFTVSKSTHKKHDRCEKYDMANRSRQVATTTGKLRAWKCCQLRSKLARDVVNHRWPWPRQTTWIQISVACNTDSPPHFGALSAISALCVGSRLCLAILAKYDLTMLQVNSEMPAWCLVKRMLISSLNDTRWYSVGWHPPNSYVVQRQGLVVKCKVGCVWVRGGTYRPY